MSTQEPQTWQMTVLVAGEVTGRPLVLDEPLSLWGGLNPQTGHVIDQRHPQVGEVVTGKILILPSGRGSSSASSILLEAIRAGTAPLAIITAESDGILSLGAVVAQEIYGRAPAVAVLKRGDYEEVVERVRGEDCQLSIADGQLSVVTS